MMRIDSECVSASDSIESLPSVKAYPSPDEKEEVTPNIPLSERKPRKQEVKPENSIKDSDNSIGTEALNELQT